MIPFLDHNYYNKMLELQEKLRKSEKNRILLEKRFCLMEQESRWRHEACLNKMQMRYIEFLEEQSVRDERNYKLLGILDRVNESLALMTVKTDRLCILKKEYEASLMRTCMNRHQVSSVTGDSGVQSQNENQQLKQDISNLSNFTPRSRYNVERRFHNSSASPDRSSQPKNYGQTNQVSLSSQEFGNQSRAALTNKLRSQYSEDLDSITKAPNYTRVLGTLLNFKNERVNSVIENELERHIHKIRNLHDNNNPYSLEEIEQNTSGDVLNVTLSDDNLDHLPVEENSKGGEIPTEFKVILTTANDLISRNVNDAHVKNDTNHVVSGQSMEKIFSDVNVGQEISSEIIAGDQIASINSAVNNSNMDPFTSTPIQNLVDKNQISNDAAMYTTKINPLIESIETITKSPCIVDSSTPNFFHLPIDEVKIENERETFANANDSSEIMNSSDSHGQPHEVEYNNDNNIKIVTNTELQNSINMILITESQVVPVNKTVNSIDETSPCQTDALYIDTVGKTCGEKNRDNNILENDGIGEAIVIQPLIQSNDNDEIHNETNETIHAGSEENYEKSHVKQYEVSDNQDLQLYPQALNQIYEYDDEQYQHDPNQQYEYDSVEKYEQHANGECQYDQKDSQYIGDSNDQFQHEQYIGNDSQQYAINLNEQYHEYSVDQNQQYGSNTYVQNPNVVYDSSEMYAYPIQQQNYMADNAYDESQTFASDQQHQDYQEQFLHYENSSYINNETMMNYHTKNLPNNVAENDIKEHHENELNEKEEIIPESEHTIRIAKDVIKSILDSDTESNVEKNISNTDSDFNFN
ncbi:hypothetical protein PV328_002418 [Microctonus aethiopoides]|uniref:Uncharacterized protein n=1 Tax=Microctonus aethiopoides TaxID=144406 RepID=A0AA39F6D5_9HYME|nr:hypothetical protein PV328_002418 [Microctonus aethiopoides]